MTVVFTLENSDHTTIDINYEPLPYEHSQLWVQGIQDFLDSGMPLTDTNRLFNFNPNKINLHRDVDILNSHIDKINAQLVGVTIPHVDYSNMQEDINFIHLNFVESDREAEFTKTVEKEDWYNLNGLLHGLETKFRRRNMRPQGQIFVELYQQRYDLPESAYEHFTVRDEFGYCYANYAHVGRHIQEMYYANDTMADDSHITPMSKISGSSRLWFGDTMPSAAAEYQMHKIKLWYNRNNIANRIGMQWGDPHLAIGWLPVAKMTNNITANDLLNVKSLQGISIQ
jgi:hypothetical protein